MNGWDDVLKKMDTVRKNGNVSDEFYFLAFQQRHIRYPFIVLSISLPFIALTYLITNIMFRPLLPFRIEDVDLIVNIVVVVIVNYCRSN